MVDGLFRSTADINERSIQTHTNIHFGLDCFLVNAMALKYLTSLKSHQLSLVDIKMERTRFYCVMKFNWISPLKTKIALTWLNGAESASNEHEKALIFSLCALQWLKDSWPICRKRTSQCVVELMLSSSTFYTSISFPHFDFRNQTECIGCNSINMGFM